MIAVMLNEEPSKQLYYTLISIISPDEISGPITPLAKLITWRCATLIFWSSRMYYRSRIFRSEIWMMSSKMYHKDAVYLNEMN